MISKEMEKALNEQINKELYSSYIYLSMATYFSDQNYDGMAQFMKVQAQEEVGHAMKIYDYVEEQGGRVLLDAIKKPQTDFDSVEQVFQMSLDHEKFITKSINELVDLAVKDNDHATRAFLDWFVTEQVEEEDTMDTIVNKIKMVSGQPHALLMLDSKLGERQSD